MTNHTYYTVVTVIFFTITLGHIFRLINEWDAVVAGVHIPLWFSWVAVGLAGYLTLRGWQVIAGKTRR